MITLPRLAAAFAVAALIALAAAGANSSFADIEHVRVEGADRLNPAAVAQLSGLRGQNIFTADLDAAEERIRRLTLVKSASASRDWINSVKLVIVERRPAGRWRSGDTVWSIDSEGIVLEGEPAPMPGPVVEQVSELPVIRPGARVDASATALADEIDRRGAPELEAAEAPRILAYRWDQAVGLMVQTEHGLVIFGSASGSDYKYEVWAGLEREAARRNEPLLLADLRFGSRPRVEMGLNAGRAARAAAPDERSFHAP